MTTPSIKPFSVPCTRRCPSRISKMAVVYKSTAQARPVSAESTAPFSRRAGKWHSRFFSVHSKSRQKSLMQTQTDPRPARTERSEINAPSLFNLCITESTINPQLAKLARQQRLFLRNKLGGLRLSQYPFINPNPATALPPRSLYHMSFSRQANTRPRSAYMASDWLSRTQPLVLARTTQLFERTAVPEVRKSVRLRRIEMLLSSLSRRNAMTARAQPPPEPIAKIGPARMFSNEEIVRGLRTGERLRGSTGLRKEKSGAIAVPAKWDAECTHAMGTRRAQTAKELGKRMQKARSVSAGGRGKLIIAGNGNKRK